MRITNKIIQRNNLSNINMNKIYQDKLSTQQSTGKKINRPSDDPVVAIRALRLRSSVTEITQYYSKNIPDANSWLEVTEGALDNLSKIVTDMIKQCKGVNGYETTQDKQIILEQLKALGDEVYKTGDADYAGRYVFTGYRTDTSLSFPEKSDTSYKITEQLDQSAITSMTKIDTGDVLNWTNANYESAAMTGMKEEDITSTEVCRIRLAYDKCKADNTVVTIEYNKPNSVDPGQSLTALTVHSYASPDPYAQAAANKDAVIFVPETGELLLGTNKRDALLAVKDNPATSYDEREIRVTYEKDSWEKGDLRPEHYFYCEAEEKQADGTTKTIKYNEDYLSGKPEKQEIEYDVGFNQTIRVNSTADECFQHGIGREVDDLIDSLQEVMDLEAVKSNMEKTLEYTTDTGKQEILKKQIQVMDKALAFSRDKCQKLFESGVTAFQGHLDSTNLSLTNCSTRSKKLELIENRMQDQKTTFEELKSVNEDVDMAEILIQLENVSLTYEAALMATGKVVQTSLLNFI